MTQSCLDEFKLGEIVCLCERVKMITLCTVSILIFSLNEISLNEIYKVSEMDTMHESIKVVC